MIVDHKGRMIETDASLLDYRDRMEAERDQKVKGFALLAGVICLIVMIVSAVGFFLETFTGSAGL